MKRMFDFFLSPASDVLLGYKSHVMCQALGQNRGSCRTVWSNLDFSRKKIPIAKSPFK